MQDSNRIVYIFGDSHCTIFLNAATKNFTAQVCGYDGASITGLNKKNSKLEYGQHVINIIRHQPKTHVVLLKLGQVDMEFILYHKLYIKTQTFTLEEYCKTLIDKYREFIKRIQEINKNVIIASINLPAYDSIIGIRDYIIQTITDNTETLKINANQNIAKLETKLDHDPKLTTFTIQQLTENFMYFNSLLAQLAIEMNLPFFDTTPAFINTETGILKDQYRCYNHHYKGYNNDTTDAIALTHQSLYVFFGEKS